MAFGGGKKKIIISSEKTNFLTISSLAFLPPLNFNDKKSVKKNDNLTIHSYFLLMAG